MATFGWYGTTREANPATNPASVTYGLLTTAAISGLALIDPRKLSVGRRAVYRGACAAASAWVAWSESRPQSDFPYVPTYVRAALAVGAAGATLGFAGASEKLDGKMHDWLTHKGVRKPRYVLAATSGALSLGAWAVSRLIDDSPAHAEEDYETQVVVLDEKERAVLDKILSATDLYGAAQLRAQLRTARHIYDPELSDSLDRSLKVDQNSSNAVPSNGQFPVIGRFTATDGNTYDININVSDGKLVYAAISVGADWDEARLEDWEDAEGDVDDIGSWPTPDEITLLIETPAGYQAVDAAKP